MFKWSLHWLFITSWDRNYFQTKLFLGIIHTWLTFALLVVKILELLGKVVKYPFSCRKIHIMVYRRGELALIPLWWLNRTHSIGLNSYQWPLFTWWAAPEFYYLLLIKHQRNFDLVDRYEYDRNKNSTPPPKSSTF